MKKQNFQKVRYEFFRFSGNGVLTGQTYTLKLEQPAEIKFIATGGPLGGVIINKNYVLEVYRRTTIGAATNLPELILSNNVNEIDVTIYTIVVTADCFCNVICKYYVNE